MGLQSLGASSVGENFMATSFCWWVYIFLSSYYCNFTIPFIDFFAWLGWATDLKTVSTEMIRKRVLRTGDGSHRYVQGSESKTDASPMRDVDHFWGFGKFLLLTWVHLIHVDPALMTFNPELSEVSIINFITFLDKDFPPFDGYKKSLNWIKGFNRNLILSLT